MSKAIKVLDITHPTSDKVDFQGCNTAELVLQLLQRYHWATYIDFSGFLLEAVIWKVKVNQSDFLKKGTGKHWGSGIMYVPASWWCLCAGLATASSFHLWDNAHLMLEPQQWQLDSFCFWGIVLLQCRMFNTGLTGGDSVLFCCFQHSHGQLQVSGLLHSCRTTLWPPIKGVSYWVATLLNISE